MIVSLFASFAVVQQGCTDTPEPPSPYAKPLNSNQIGSNPSQSASHGSWPLDVSPPTMTALLASTDTPVA